MNIIDQAKAKGLSVESVQNYLDTKPTNPTLDGWRKWLQSQEVEAALSRDIDYGPGNSWGLFDPESSFWME